MPIKTIPYQIMYKGEIFLVSAVHMKDQACSHVFHVYCAELPFLRYNITIPQTADYQSIILKDIEAKIGANQSNTQAVEKS